MHYDLIQINDLHLGAHNCEFSKIRKLINRIRKGKISSNNLIIAGDFLNKPRLSKLSHKHRKLIKTVSKLSKKMNVLWIIGNHDPHKIIIEEVLNIPCAEEFIFITDDIRIYITHGHKQDFYLNKHPIIVNIADAVYNLTQIVEPSHTLAKFLKKKSKKFIKATSKVGLGVAIAAKENGCQKAMHGHNHKAGMHTIEGIEVWDGGCFTEKPSTYLTVYKGKIELHKAK